MKKFLKELRQAFFEFLNTGLFILILSLFVSCAGFEIATYNHTPIKKTRVVVDYSPPVVYHYPTWPYRHYTYFEPARVIIIKPEKLTVRVKGRRGSNNQGRSTSTKREYKKRD